MSGGPFDLDGVPHVTLEYVAEIYGVRETWLIEICERGLVGERRRWIERRAVALVELDRVATLLRFHVQLGVDLETLHLVLPAPPAIP